MKDLSKKENLKSSPKPEFILSGKTEKEIVEHCLFGNAKRKYEDTIEWHTINLEAVRKRESKDGGLQPFIVNVKGINKTTLDILYSQLKLKSQFKDKQELAEFLQDYALSLLAEYCGIKDTVELRLVGSELETVRVRLSEKGD